MKQQRVAVVTAWVCCLALVGVVQADSLVDWEAAVSAARPLHWYKFNEITGENCLDSGLVTGARGGQPDKLNGTYDGPMAGQAGLFGPTSAAVFSRTLGADCVNFPGATNLAGSWTAEYIVMSTVTATERGDMPLHDGDTTSLRLACYTLSGEVGFTLYGVADYGFTPSAGYTRQNLIAPRNEWLHLVLRRDSSGTQVFVNGDLLGTNSNGVDLPRLRIGAVPAYWGLECVLDEAVVYNRPLSNEEILAHAAIVGIAAAEVRNRNSATSPPSGNVLVCVESPDIAALINGNGGGMATLLSDGQATGLTVARITTAGGWPWSYNAAGAPPAGRCRLTLRARMASGQGGVISVVIGRGLGEDGFNYRATATLDFSNVSPADGFVVRSCDLDLLMPVTPRGYYIRVWFADNMDVDWYTLESLPGGGSSPVEVVQAQTEKLFYRTDSNVVANVRLLNTSSVVQVVHLRIRLESGLSK